MCTWPVVFGMCSPVPVQDAAQRNGKHSADIATTVWPDKDWPSRWLSRTCVALGGYVVEIDSAAEQFFVNTTFFDSKGRATEAEKDPTSASNRQQWGLSSWLGYLGDQGKKKANVTSFVSLTTGKSLGGDAYKNFPETEPNNDNGPQDCLTGDLVRGEGQWDDIQCVPSPPTDSRVELFYAGVVCEKGEQSEFTSTHSMCLNCFTLESNIYVAILCPYSNSLE